MRGERARPFSASGTLAQVSDWAGRPAPLSEAQAFVPPALYHSLALLLGEDTPGVLTPGQSFEGVITDSDWEEMRGARVTVDHNSWFTADLPALLTDPGISETPIVGLAWGTFDLNRGQEDYYQGSYALLVGGPSGGVLVLDSACEVSEALSAAVSAAMGREAEVRAAVAGLTDSGDFTAGLQEARGAFRKIGDTGTVLVAARGCLGNEEATFSVNATRQSD